MHNRICLPPLHKLVVEMLLNYPPGVTYSLCYQTHVKVLLDKITDFQEILPLIESLRKPSIKPRHWQEVMAIAKTTFPYELESFSLADIMGSPILKFKDDVLEVGVNYPHLFIVATKSYYFRASFGTGMS